MKINIIHRIQWRYAVAAAFITMFLVGAAYYGSQKLNQARGATSENLKIRAELLEHSRQTRQAIMMMQESLSAYHMNQDSRQHPKNILAHLHHAIQHIEMLQNHPWLNGDIQQLNIELIRSNLNNLEQVLERLITIRGKIRKNSGKSSGQGDGILRLYDHLSKFYDNNYLLLDKNYVLLVNEEGSRSSYKPSKDLSDIHDNIGEIKDKLRNYLSHRLASDADIDITTSLLEQKITPRFKTLMQQLDKLTQTGNQQKLIDPEKINLAVSNHIAQLWFAMYEVLRENPGVGRWPLDMKITMLGIEPQVKALWRGLIALDNDIESYVTADITELSAVAQTQTSIIVGFTLFGILLIVAGYFDLNRTILQPLSTITQALRSGSRLQENPDLPNTQFQETKDLVNALTTMSKAVHERQTALEHHALHDTLTNLSNRASLNERLEQALKTAHRYEHNLSLLVIDLNHFKEVNDTLGHPVGDQLLVKVSTRLSSLLRDSDTIARLGGDEFAILLPDAQLSQAKEVARKIVTELSKPFMLSNQQLYIGASIGISIFPDHGETVETLVQRADIAMYSAKKNKLGFTVYDDQQNHHSVQRLGLMTDLRNAIKEDHLQLFYQPKISFADGVTTGAEALLRWHHPEHGYIKPGEIIKLAEQTGLIEELTYWALETAARQASEWHDQGYKLNVAVNLYVNNLHNSRIVDQVRMAMRGVRIAPGHLTLEITEDAMMADPKRTIDILGQLNDMGVQIAVDDFGTGFSSLNYLKQLPVKELKIDKSFVMNMGSDENDAVIVRSTIELAHNLGLRVVAEGVESREIWDLLQMLRCDAAQGYFMSKPVATDTFMQWLKTPKILPTTESESVSRIK